MALKGNGAEMAASTSHQRQEVRERVDLEGPTLRVASGATELVKLHDVSSRGFRADWPHKLGSGDQVWLKLPGMDALSARVAWELDLMIGCKFDVPLHPAVLAKIVNRTR
jgi:hypothetical protein